MKNFLAIDTSSEVLGLALKTGDRNLVETKVVGFLKHAENLMPMMVSLLKNHKLHAKDIDVFLIDRGPGSFTGLRIGFATLKGFLALEKKACFGALSLDMIAENVSQPEGAKLAVILDARRDRFYFRSYQRRGGVWSPLHEAKILTFSELISSLPAPISVAGDALERYEDKLKEAITSKSGVRFLPKSCWYPSAATLIRWYDMKSKHPNSQVPLKKLEKPADFLPLYFRLSEAEEKIKHVSTY